MKALHHLEEKALAVEHKLAAKAMEVEHRAHDKIMEVEHHMVDDLKGAEEHMLSQAEQKKHQERDEQSRVAAHQRTFDTEEYDTTDIFNALQEEAKVRPAPPRPLQRAALPAAAQRCADPAPRAGRRAWACSMPWTSCRSA